jgi:uncharacterized protein (DUF362 family)
MNIKQATKYLLGFVPEPIPVGRTSMTNFMDEVLEIAGKLADEESMRYVMANMIQGLPPRTRLVTKQYFVGAMRKVAANQVAAAIFLEIQDAQKALLAKKQAEAMASQKQEATTPAGNASGETQTQASSN